MKYHDFIGQVQHRAHLPDLGGAVKATRVVLQTFARRIEAGERDDVSAQLPEEIAYYIKQVNGLEKYDLQEFYQTVSELEGVKYPTAIHHAKAVMTVLQEAVSGGEANDIAQQLPPEFAELFEHQWKE